MVLDLGSRRVVGWAMRETLETELAVTALRAALADRPPTGEALLHHADRGGQYASAAYRTLLAAHGVTERMNRKGDCWDTRSRFPPIRSPAALPRAGIGLVPSR